MSRFVGQLRDGLKRCGLQGDRLLIGVSGGADSVALLRGLIELTGEFSLELIPAHLNHGLRGSASDADAEFVQGLCSRFGLPCEIERAECTELSPGQTGLEEAARHLRHQFLSAAAARTGCGKIALAHHLDDQAETVLHHVLRGTGIAGLRGIPAIRRTSSGIPIVRPMLSIRRTEIEAYLGECSQPYRDDASNMDTSLTRNCLRHVVLPLLREKINPQVDTALARLSEQAADAEEFLQTAARRLLEQALLDRQPETCRIDVSRLSNQPQQLVREAFRELWHLQQWPQQAMGFEQWNRLLELLATRTPMTLPNRIEARFHSDTLLVLRRR